MVRRKRGDIYLEAKIVADGRKILKVNDRLDRGLPLLNDLVIEKFDIPSGGTYGKRRKRK